jgi:hypothetical protein
MAIKGIPVVVSDRGIPVKPVEGRAPLMTVAENGFGLPVFIADEGAPFVVDGLQDFGWGPIDLTAGTDGVQWIGYSSGGATLPQPGFGSLSGQPSTVTNLLALYDDTNSNVYLAVFSGDWLAYLSDLPLSIGGTPFTPFNANVISGNTWIRYEGVGDFIDGALYQIEFG